MYVARVSQHIEEDIKRNWSSWSFGEAGFEGTKEELDECLSKITDDSPFFISGFDIYPDSLHEYRFGELYENYWVVIDDVNAKGGLSCIMLDAETLEEAIEEAEKEIDFLGDGSSFDARYAKLVYSDNEKDLHIFETEDWF